MGEVTEIAWTDHTWNPWIGCAKVSPGCAHCYAEEQMDLRWHKAQWGKGKPRTRAVETTRNLPYKWDAKARKAGVVRTVFCLSLGDIYDPEVTDEWRTDIFRVISETRNLFYLLLTKRPEEIDRYHNDACWPESGCAMRSLGEFKNVALGVSVENDDYRWRIDAALEQKCRVTFVSAEPLLGPLHIRKQLQSGLGWVIAGGESGGAARDCEIEHIEDLMRQCADYKVPFFNKQLGARPTQKSAIFGGDSRIELPMIHKKGGDMMEWPPHLRVQETPDWEALLHGAA